MRRSFLVLSLALIAFVSSQAQMTSTKPPQTARQALLEMFLGKSPDAFAKHLPKATMQALMRKGEGPETTMLQRISGLGRQMTAGEHFESFDVGPTLLVSEQKDGGDKFTIEVVVDHDSLLGETDEIQLSLELYRNGQPEFLPVYPSLVFSLIQEDEVWKLSDVMLTARVPLTDPEYLKGARKKMNELDEDAARGRVSLIAMAETRYSSQHPGKGYSCNLSELFKGDADLATNVTSGYRFSISGCEGSPVTRFQVIAVPVEEGSGMKAFCADESGKERFDANGDGTACLSHGLAVR